MTCVKSKRWLLFGLVGLAAAAAVGRMQVANAQGDDGVGRKVLTGQDALGDWTTDAPGVRRKITTADLPRPYATRSIDNGPKMIARPDGAMPKVPEGFKVELFAEGFSNPREIITAPNGDLFIAESEANKITVLRAPDGAGKVNKVSTFAAQGLELPFGLAFYPPGPDPKYLYVGNTGAVVRFPYKKGDLEATGPAETIVPDLPHGGRLRGGGHWTRNVRFSRDGKKMFVSVGSKTNASDVPEEARRATILEYNPDGSGFREYATGIRNAVGLAVHPDTGDVWCSVNERDEIGDDLVPDYVTSVKRGGFYGWPWYYIGGNQDPRHPGKRPELKDKVIVPDVLLQSHSASLGMAFYTGSQFPRNYRLDAFACEHGSWNRSRRTGYKVVHIPLRDGKATGVYEDFMTGFVTSAGNVWGRPVGVTVAKDGSLFVTDDGGKVVWRVSYEK